MPKIPYLSDAMALIISQPHRWNQQKWFCGSTACLAGHICLDAGAEPLYTSADDDLSGVVRYQGDTRNAGRLAQDLAGLTRWESQFLFWGGRTMPELYEAVSRLERDLALHHYISYLRHGDGGFWTDPDGLLQVARHRSTVYRLYDGRPMLTDHATRALAHEAVLTVAIARGNLTHHPSTPSEVTL